MFSRKTFGISTFVMSTAVIFWASTPALSGESQRQNEGDTVYLPIQSISYEFGSKAISGYFVSQGSACLLSLMISDKSDPDRLSPTTAARVRLMLEPGQIAGLDSEEGRSLNLTCGGHAKTLVVNYGERSKLVTQQGVAVQNTIADRVEERR
jgi:hypothetical protein